MLVLNLDTGKESHFSANTSPEYALAYAAAFDEGLLDKFWDMDKETLYKSLPFRKSTCKERDILYLGTYLTDTYGTVINASQGQQRAM